MADFYTRRLSVLSGHRRSLCSPVFKAQAVSLLYAQANSLHFHKEDYYYRGVRNKLERGEWDYVIFSTVRSLPDYKIEQNPTYGWCKHNLGFITDENQVNVALTRARKGLIIIGNKNLLSCDQNVWKKLINYYKERGCLRTPVEFPPRSFRTRRQRMEENIEESKRRYGESMFKKGEATSYTGSFDDWQEDRRGRRRRHKNQYES